LKKLIAAFAAAAAFTLASSGAGAAGYPERTITVVVPFAAGGPTDTVTRLVAEAMSKDLGQQIIVENVGGAGGTLGAAQVANADPDGYTLLLHHIGMATSATLYRKLPYDTLKSFEYVGLVTEVPMTIVARKDFPPTDFKDLVTHVKANKDTVTMANAGIGAASHLCGMMFMSAIGTPLLTVPYKTLDAFEYVGLVTDVPMTILAKKDMEATDLKSLVEYAKANADKVPVANAGIGAASHLCGMLFMSAIDTPLVTVPYKGTGPAMTDLLGSQVDIMCDQTTNTTKHIKAGTIKAYAVTSPQRLDVLPDLPTVAEGGLPNMEVAIWHGLYAPKGTPAEITARLSKSLQLALKDPNVVARFAELGTIPSSEADATPAALKAKLESEIARWKPIIEGAGQYAD